MRKLVSLVASILGLWASYGQPVDVPVELSHGRMIFTGRIGEVESLKFLLDSACTISTIRPEVVDRLKLSPSGRVRIYGIAGQERAPTYRGVVFHLGGVQYAPRRVASIPSERNERRRRDGVLDAGFFRQYVIEFRPGVESVRLHSASNFVYEGSGDVVSFRFRDEIPVLQGAIDVGGKDPIPVELELDTGCDSGLCLGESFVKKHDLVKAVEGRSSEKFGVGGSVDTHSGQIRVVRVGKTELRDVQTDFFLSGSPVDEPLSGHIGMAALGKRKIIFDYHRKRLIIE